MVVTPGWVKQNLNYAKSDFLVFFRNHQKEVRITRINPQNSTLGLVRKEKAFSSVRMSVTYRFPVNSTVPSSKHQKIWAIILCSYFMPKEARLIN